jgi:hypothetical protein
MKLRICKNTIDAMVRHTAYQNHIKRKWVGVIRYYYRLRMAMRLQKAYRVYRLRLLFWAKKTIKHLFMEYFVVWLIKKRHRREQRRQQEEEAACQQMVDRAHLYLRKLLQSADGSAMLWTFLREVGQAEPIED